MHSPFRAIASRIAAALAAALVIASAQPTFADVPLPVIDVVPQQMFTVGANTQPQVSPPAKFGVPDQGLFLGGTATLPLFKGFSLSYDNVVGGSLDSYLIAVPIGSALVYPGGSRDVIQNYRGDYHTGPFNLEAGFGARHRECCPYGGFEWHKAFVGLSYSTPHFAFLNGGFFVLDITGNGTHYAHPVTDPSVPTSLPALQAAYGANIPNNKNVFSSQQAVTAIVPIDLKHGVRTATTFLWGALDYPVNGPFPQKYDIWIVSATKQFNEYFGLTANVQNVTQRQQGYPFPSPDAIHTTALAIAADFHLDFHKFANQGGREQGRTTRPGAPGGPGGPAPISPTQGGSTAAPSPMASGMPGAMPMSSPTPEMAPAPMMSSGPGTMPVPSPTP